MKKPAYPLLLLAALAGCNGPAAQQPGNASPNAGAAAAPAAPGLVQARVFVTAQGTADRLAPKPAVAFVAKSQPEEHVAAIIVDYKKPYQTVVGIGGAFTDAAAETFYKLPKDKQQELLTAYFDREKGLGYSLGRTSIHSCDFSSASYTYVADGDSALKTFSIDHDRQYRLPFIQAALKVAGPLTMFVSPWSPPAWMKSNRSMLHGGKLLPAYRHAWARYYTRFVAEYEKAGVPIWGLTVQNEPMAAQTWESCEYTGEEEKDFVKGFLGPELHRAGYARLKLMIWDHNRGLMFQRAQNAYDDPEAAKYIWGTAFHWYVGNHFDNVRQVRDAFPDKHLFFSEGCLYPFDLAKVDEWHWGETYGESLVNDFQNGAEGWTDWNLIVDEKGGPNHVQNYCFAPVVADTRTGKVHYMSSFYYLGHFSRFVRPGARRLACTSTVDELQATSFRNPDGSLATVVLNKTNQPVVFQLWMAGKAARTTAPAHSILTLVQ